MELQLHKYQILGQISISSSCDDQCGRSRTLSQSIKYMTVTRLGPAELQYKNEEASMDVSIQFQGLQFTFYMFEQGGRTWQP